MGSKPLVSIVMPLHNGELYLQESFDSIQRQTYDNIEVVIMDDGSEDRTPELTDTVCRLSRYPVRRSRRSRAAGAAATHNELISAASGEWVKFVHQDDILEADAIEKFVGYAGSVSPVVLCHTTLIDETGNPIGRFPWGLRTEQPVFLYQPGELSAVTLRLGNVIGNPPNLFFHRSARDYFIMDTRFENSWDWQALIRVADALPVLIINSPLVRFRHHRGSLSWKFHRTWICPEEDLRIVLGYPFASPEIRRACVWRQVLHLLNPLLRATAEQDAATVQSLAAILADNRKALATVFSGHEVWDDLDPLIRLAERCDLAGMARHLERPKSIVVQLAKSGAIVTWELLTEISQSGSRKWSVVGTHPWIDFLTNLLRLFGDTVASVGATLTAGPTIVAGASRLEDYLLWNNLVRNFPDWTIIRAFEWLP